MNTLTQLPRADWLAARRKGVGASEAAAILGLSPWKTPLAVYFDKLGIATQEQTALMRFGLLFESGIAAAYEQDTGRQLVKPAALLAHPEAPWMLASLDYTTANSDRVVEIKKVSQHAAGKFGASGTSEIPEHYMLQVQQQMAVSGIHNADLAALIGDDDFRVYTIEFQPAIVARLVEVEREFMDRVARRDPPLPDFTHPSTAELLAMIEPEIGETVDLTEAEQELVDAYERFGATARELEADRKSLKAQLIHAMGTAEAAHLPDGRILTRKSVTRRAYSVEESTFIDFRIKENRRAKTGRV